MRDEVWYCFTTERVGTGLSGADLRRSKGPDEKYCIKNDTYNDKNPGKPFRGWQMGKEIQIYEFVVFFSRTVINYAKSCKTVSHYFFINSFYIGMQPSSATNRHARPHAHLMCRAPPAAAAAAMF